MAPAALALNETLRPWYNAGLHFLLDDEGDLVTNLCGSPEAACECVSHTSPYHQAAGQGAPASPPVQPATPVQRPSAAYTAPQPAAKPQPQRETIRAAEQRRPVRVPEPENKPAIHPSTQSPEEWPQMWQTMWGRVAKPSPIVWTYWSLGNDLGGNANAERGALLRSIIGSLQLPKGSSAFWPVAVPQSVDVKMDDDALLDNPGIFLAGLRRIRPRYCITFGSKALKSFAPTISLRPYMFTQFMGHRLIALPDIDILLQNKGPVPAVIAFLQTAISLKG